jgi:hypothetical protein
VLSEALQEDLSEVDTGLSKSPLPHVRAFYANDFEPE